MKKRHAVLRKDHEQMAAALQTIERGTLLAEQLKTQLGHEKMVLEQKKEVRTVFNWSGGEEKGRREEGRNDGGREGEKEEGGREEGRRVEGREVGRYKERRKG